MMSLQDILLGRGKRICLALAVCLSAFSTAVAQVGEHRNEMAVGVNGGLALSNIGFVPKVPQSLHNGLTGGLSFRYTSEKYFNSI